MLEGMIRDDEERKRIGNVIQVLRVASSGEAVGIVALVGEAATRVGHIVIRIVLVVDIQQGRGRAGYRKVPTNRTRGRVVGRNVGVLTVFSRGGNVAFSVSV